ncbi:MAG: hypothetical protein R3Y64_05520 [Peptostreptococcaceae bacterium]
MTNYEKIFNNILDELYKKIIIDNSNDINNLLTDIKNKDLFLGNNYDDFIINLIPKEKEGYEFRCSISKLNNCNYPILYTKRTSANKYSILLWESHMNDFLIDKIYSVFTKDKCYLYLENNLDAIKDIISNKSKITLNLDFNNLLEDIKEKIKNNQIDFQIAYELIDLDKLRDYLIINNVNLDSFNEFDKIEDDFAFCIKNFSIFNKIELENFIKNNINKFIK